MKTRLTINFEKIFGQKAETFIDCGGRFEILGNHTDHNHGLCLAATCDLKVACAVAKNDNNLVEIISEGSGSYNFSIENPQIDKEKFFRSDALVSGIAAYFIEHGYKVGGFKAYIESTIFPGAGVSSSAAFELLICKIFSVLYNNDDIPQMVMAKAGQFAENEFFGKKCGLLDQIGVGFGAVSFIDFKNIESPFVQTVDFPFDDINFVIVNTGGSHATLSDLYSAIPTDMKNAANKMGHEFLRECSLEELELYKDKLTEIEYSRAIHFFNENDRVKNALEALTNKDKAAFFKAINGSRISSTEYLKNMMVGDDYSGSPLQACDLAMSILNEKGAAKINGGGFAGSIICAVDNSILRVFVDKMIEKYGVENVKPISIRKTGPSIF